MVVHHVVGKQIHGWQVKRGKKFIQIQHWIWVEEQVRLGQNGQAELDSQGKPIKERVRLARPKVIGLRCSTLSR
jgi:hypothetical protein